MKYTREITNGFIIFIGIGIYFAIMELLGLSEVYILRILNGVIVAYGINRTIKGNIYDGIRGYFTNFLAGFMTSMIGALLSIAGLFLFIKVKGGQEFLEKLPEAFLIGGGDVNLYTYTFALLVLESTAASLILVFVLMQYWKDKAEVINKID